jgi:hypothetical protein
MTAKKNKLRHVRGDTGKKEKHWCLMVFKEGERNEMNTVPP